MGGEGPISYIAIRSYARDNNITGSDFKMFGAFMSILDLEWLRRVDERDRQKGREQNGRS